MAGLLINAGPCFQRFWEILESRYCHLSQNGGIGSSLSSSAVLRDFLTDMEASNLYQISHAVHVAAIVDFLPFIILQVGFQAEIPL